MPWRLDPANRTRCPCAAPRPAPACPRCKGSGEIVVQPCPGEWLACVAEFLHVRAMHERYGLGEMMTLLAIDELDEQYSLALMVVEEELGRLRHEARVREAERTREQRGR